MKAASIQTIKKELQHLPNDRLMEICLRLAKHKKENKELLDYLLFDQENEALYIENVKEYLSELFDEINVSHVYFAKKSVQKILRTLNKYLRYSGKKETSVELLIYFCQKVRDMPVNYKRSPILKNLYQRQVAKIEKDLSSLHEDFQLDFEDELAALKS